MAFAVPIFSEGFGLQLKQMRNVVVHYGNIGCGVSRSRIQNPIEFFLKMTCFKGYLLKLNEHFQA